jgi:PPOX class probable FMN-dependent enzyme
LEHRGFEVFIEANGLAALTALESFRPEAVILDILLPGMDGEHVLNRLRRHDASLPVIMLTARDAVSVVAGLVPANVPAQPRMEGNPQSATMQWVDHGDAEGAPFDYVRVEDEVNMTTEIATTDRNRSAVVVPCDSQHEWPAQDRPLPDATSGKLETLSTSAVTTDSIAQLRAHKVSTVHELHAINGTPSDMIAQKDTNYLTPLIEEFIARSPFFLIATADADGNCDVSPKGDAPGVVKMVDPHTIAIPDRLGNKRIDGHRNILANGHVGLIFMIPNIDETLRINGRCFITTEPDLLASMALQGRAPKLAMVVEIDEVYMHCARSFLRSGLWKPETWPEPDTIPTLAAIMCEQKNLPSPDESTGKRQEEYRTRLF